jgi:hypothetical protein
MRNIGPNIRGIVAFVSGTYIHEGSFLRKHDHQQCGPKALMLVMFSDGNLDMTFDSIRSGFIRLGCLGDYKAQP